MKVLIVEDNERIRRLLRTILSGLVTTFFECEDGIEALAAYDAHLPDWVLMDIQMEHMDGLTATRQIRAVHPFARIMIVTDYDDAQLRADAMQAGACGYVLKDNLLRVLPLLQSPDHREPAAQP